VLEVLSFTTGDGRFQFGGSGADIARRYAELALKGFDKPVCKSSLDPALLE